MGRRLKGLLLGGLRRSHDKVGGAGMRTWELEVGGSQKVLVGEFKRGLGNWCWIKKGTCNERWRSILKH